MTNFRIPVSVALMALGFAAQGVNAQPAGAGFGPHRPRVAFSTLDADGNGVITPAEVTKFRAARFAKADTNGDGFLSADELIAQAEKRLRAKVTRNVERMLKWRDTNGDGKLSMDELGGGKELGLLMRMDRNGDGKISKSEYESMLKRLAHRGRRGRGKARFGQARRGSCNGDGAGN